MKKKETYRVDLNKVSYPESNERKKYYIYI